MSSRIEKLIVGLLAAMYSLSAVGFMVTTPYGEPPDEPGHLSYIVHIYRYGYLPEIKFQAYTFDAFQPPLYYSIGAAIVLLSNAITGEPGLDEPIATDIKTRPMSEVGVDGHWARFRNPEERRWLLWPMILRIPSMLMGLGMVLLTYLTARALVPAPAPPAVALIATAFAALIPGANHIRASISNSNLTDLVSAWAIYLMVAHLMRPHSNRRIVWLGVALALGLLSKLSASLLFLPAVWVLWLRRDSYPALVRDMVRFAVPVLVIAGPFYLYRTITYGDPLALAAMQEMLQPDSVFRLTDLFWFQETFRMMLWTSFWGVYGHQVLWMPWWIYNVFAWGTVAAGIGGAYLLIRRALTRAQIEACAVLLLAILLMYALVIQASTYLIAWQGRELYPALSGICVLLGLGLGGLFLGKGAVQSEPLGTRRAMLANGLVAAVIAALVALNVYVLVWMMAPGMTSS